MKKPLNEKVEPPMMAAWHGYRDQVMVTGEGKYTDADLVCHMLTFMAGCCAVLSILNTAYDQGGSEVSTVWSALNREADSFREAVTTHREAMEGDDA
jgi:hypothetical protein